MKTILSVIIILLFLNTPAKSQDTLFVYGPGGTGAAMEEAAKVFSKKNSIPVKVIAGPEAKWIEQANNKADIIFGGAEYMLDQFIMHHPGMVDSTTRRELYKRGAGILVRPGNPKKITSLQDLTKPGLHLLNVNGAGQMGMWEDLAGRQNLIEGIQKNIKKSFANTALAIDAWKSDKSYDAIIIFSSWYYRLKDVSQLIKIPPAQTVYRGTPVAITTITNQKREAHQFIHFLLSAQGHSIFNKWGWE